MTSVGKLIPRTIQRDLGSEGISFVRVMPVCCAQSRQGENDPAGGPVGVEQLSGDGWASTCAGISGGGLDFRAIWKIPV